MAKERFFNLKIIKGAFEPPPEGYRDACAGPPERGKDFIGETETPLLDIYEDPEAIVVEADLPGIDPKGVTIRLANNQVLIEGSRLEHGEGPDAGHYLRMERCREDFRRIIPLPVAVDPQRVEAYYRQGVLVLKFPRIQERRNRAIKIEIK